MRRTSTFSLSVPSPCSISVNVWTMSFSSSISQKGTSATFLAGTHSFLSPATLAFRYIRSVWLPRMLATVSIFLPLSAVGVLAFGFGISLPVRLLVVVARFLLARRTSSTTSRLLAPASTFSLIAGRSSTGACRIRPSFVVPNFSTSSAVNFLLISASAQACGTDIPSSAVTNASAVL